MNHKSRFSSYLHRKIVAQPTRNNESIVAIEEDRVRLMKLNRTNAWLFAILGAASLFAGYWLASGHAFRHIAPRNLLMYGCFGEGVILLISAVVATRMYRQASGRTKKTATPLR